MFPGGSRERASQIEAAMPDGLSWHADYANPKAAA